MAIESLPLQAGDWGPLSQHLIAIEAVTQGGSRPSKYVIATDGTTVTGYDATGVIVASGPDGGAVLTACLPAANAAGTMIQFRNDGNVFPWTTVPALPKGITGQLVIVGNGAKILLSSSAPRFLDLNRTADYDTFQNITIDGFQIDANNLGGQHHVVFGTYIAGVYGQRLNIQNITLRNLRAINVLRDPNTGTNHRRGICIVTTDPGAGSQTNLTNILIENCRIDGGNAGFEVASQAVTSTTVFVDLITVKNCYHDSGTVPTAFYAAVNLQVGGYAFGGRVVVDGFYGANSADVGIEIDNKTECTITNATIVDSFTAAYYATNFNAPLYPRAQYFHYYSCHARKLNITGAASKGWLFGGNGNTQMGTVLLDACTWLNNTLTWQQGDAISMNTTTPTAGYRQIILRGFRCDIDAYDMTVSSGNIRQAALVLSAPAGTTMLTNISDCHVYINGARHAGSVNSFFMNAVTFAGAGTFVHDIDGLYCDITQTNGVSTSVQAVDINSGGGYANTHQGIIRRVVYTQVSGDTQAIGVRFGTGSTYNGLTFEACDFAAIGTGGNEFSFQTVADKQNIRLRGNRWKTVPAPVAFTGLVTATGKTLAQGWDAAAVFTQGSGSAITAVDYSTNGGTTYTNFLTQASAALPAGFDQMLSPLKSDDLIKATFTTTQPTITLVPVNP